jgi:hypothetical protein
MAAGSIVVDLLMRTGSFETDTKRAEAALKKFQKQAIEAGKMAGQAIAAFAGGMAVMVQQTVQANAEMQRFAALSNTSNSNFQALATGAKTVGIEADKMADIFKDVQDKVGDFMQTGGGAMADFFENIAPKVGVTAEQFRQLSGPDALQLYVDSLEKANLSQSDMVFYMEAIASDASLLLPLLKNGGEGFREYADMAQRFGVILEDDALAAMNDFKRANDITQLAMRGFANQVTQAIVPAFMNMVNVFANADTGARNLSAAAQIAATGFKGLMSVGALVVGVFKTLGEMFGGLAAVFVNLFSGRFREAYHAFEATSMDMVANTRKTVDAMKSIWAEYTPTSGAIPAPVMPGRLSAARGTTAGAGATGNAAGDGFDSWMQANREAELQHYLKMLDKREAEEMASQERLRAEAERYYTATRTPIEQLNVELANQQRLLDAIGPAYQDTYFRAVEAAQEAYESTRQVSQEMDSFAKQAAENIQGQLGEGLYQMMQGSFKDIGASFKQMLDRMVAEALAAQLARRMFGGLAGGEGAGWFGNALSSLGSTLFGGAKAGGGDVIGGRAYLVGEQGPEMFVPRTSGAILPNMAGAGAAGGSMSIVNNFTVSGAVDRRTQLQIANEASLALRRGQRNL